MIALFYLMSAFAALILLLDTIFWETRMRLGCFDHPGLSYETEYKDLVTALMFDGKSQRIIMKQYGIRKVDILKWARS